MRIVEHVPDQRKGRGRDRRAGDAKQSTRRDQHFGAPRIRRDNRRHSEGAGPQQQQSTAADAVAQRTHRDQRTGDKKSVDVEDPQELRARRFQIRAQVGHSKVQHREVHRVEHARQRNDREANPLTTRCF